MFSGEDIARLLPKNIKSLAQDIKNFPLNYTKWLYGSVQTDVYQADIIRELTVVAIDEDGAPVGRVGPTMVVSHTCDSQPGQCEFVLIAPVFDLEERHHATTLPASSWDSHVRDLRANR